MKMMAMSIFIAGAYLGPSFGCRAAQLAERLGSGDGEGWTLLTRQIAFESLLSWAASKSQDDHLTKTSLF
jgi:hypothetical protein